MEEPKTFWDTGSTIDEAAKKASEKAKHHGKGYYSVTIQANVDDSIHDYKVILAPVDG